MQKNQVEHVYYDQEHSTDAHIVIWGDSGRVQTLDAISGVVSVSNQTANKYQIEIDPRFDRELVLEEIIQALTPAWATEDENSDDFA